MSLPRITILGSLNIDLVSYVHHHPRPGETLIAESFTTSPGGKGANQAVACSKLSRSRPPGPSNPSAQINLLGAVGSDAHGQTLLESIEASGVDTSRVVVSGHKTGVAVITVDREGENRIIISPEANHEVLPGAEFLYGAPTPDLLVVQLEIRLPTVLDAMEAAKSRGVPVLLNAAPAQWLPHSAYRDLTHLLVNETEAKELSGHGKANLADKDGMERVAAEFLKLGVENVVITLGARGVFYATRSGSTGLVDAVDTTVVDTTAAGDTFVGSYALTVVGSRGADVFDIHAAVTAANRASSITVSRKGAQSSIPWRDELA